MELENHAITNGNYHLEVTDSMLDGSSFSCVSLKNMKLDDVNMEGTEISNANLSNIKVNGAQMGNAVFENIDTPPLGHPAYKENAKQMPIKFTSCNLEASVFTSCNLENVEFSNCNISGLRINGILIEELLKSK